MYNSAIAVRMDIWGRNMVNDKKISRQKKYIRNDFFKQKKQN